MKTKNTITETFTLDETTGCLSLLHLQRPGYYIAKIDRKNNKTKVIFKKKGKKL